MIGFVGRGIFSVTCRTGSLEISDSVPTENKVVTCRTGSLEMAVIRIAGISSVTCRTGSLEM